MITENLSTLKINRLTQEQYDRELLAGNIKDNELYLTPDENKVIFYNNETITLRDGTYYVAGEEISSLTILYSDEDFISSIELTTASEGVINITLPESKYIGEPPTFLNGETWELNIRNGVVIGGLVE